MLLLRANQVVGRSSIIDELWGENAPCGAATTAQTYVYQIRKKCQRRFDQIGWGELVETRPPGYVLRAEEPAIDPDRRPEGSPASQLA
ncbi:AfsR/SARP family transcriptional regulator [Micromonospora rubida]